MSILSYILVATIALFMGVFIGRATFKIDGLFLVDDSNDETDRWILDVKTDPKLIPNKKNIRLKVQKMTGGGV